MTIEEMIDAAAVKERLDPNLLRALINQESGGNPKIVSKKGAAGLMQLMPSTAERFGVQDVFDPEQNLAGGTKFLAQLLTKYKGDIPKTLAAYNAGEENVEKYGGVPPFPETQEYVKNITARLGDKGASKGNVIYEGTDPATGAKIRISAARGTKPEDLGNLFSAESKRQSGIKETIKPFSGDIYASPVGRGTLAAGEAVESSPFLRQPEHEPLVEVGKNYPGAVRGLGDKYYSTPSGKFEEPSMDITGLIPGYGFVKDLYERGLPEAIGSAVGGGLGAPPIPTTAARYARNVARRTFTEPGVSRTGATLGYGLGTYLGHEAGIPSPYATTGPAMATVGAKVPAMIRGFRKGLGEPITDVNVESYAQPTRGPTGVSGAEAASQGPPSYAPVKPKLTGPPYGVETSIPGQLPEATGKPAIQMGPAREIPIYGGKPGLARASESGLYTPRQRRLDLRQEGANIPPPKEAGAEPFNIRKEDLGSLGKPYQKPIEMEQVGERSKTVSQKELNNLARILKSTPEEVLKSHPDLSLEKTPEFSPKTTKIASSKVILPSAVKDYARVHGVSLEEAEKHFRDQGYEIRKRSLRKSQT